MHFNGQYEVAVNAARADLSIHPVAMAWLVPDRHAFLEAQRATNRAAPDPALVRVAPTPLPEWAPPLPARAEVKVLLHAPCGHCNQTMGNHTSAQVQACATAQLQAWHDSGADALVFFPVTLLVSAPPDAASMDALALVWPCVGVGTLAYATTRGPAAVAPDRWATQLVAHDNVIPHAAALAAHVLVRTVPFCQTVAPTGTFPVLANGAVAPHPTLPATSAAQPFSLAVAGLCPDALVAILTAQDLVPINAGPDGAVPLPAVVGSDFLDCLRHRLGLMRVDNLPPFHKFRPIFAIDTKGDPIVHRKGKLASRVRPPPHHPPMLAPPGGATPVRLSQLAEWRVRNRFLHARSTTVHTLCLPLSHRLPVYLSWWTAAATGEALADLITNAQYHRRNDTVWSPRLLVLRVKATQAQNMHLNASVGRGHAVTGSATVPPVRYVIIVVLPDSRLSMY